MGTYVQLDCLSCDATLSFGKPIRRGAVITLRLFSERQQDWTDGIECWQALQAFLFKHRDHRLVFRRDDSRSAQEVETEEEFDELLNLWRAGAPYD